MRVSRPPRHVAGKSMPAFSAASKMYMLSGQSASLNSPSAARNFSLYTLPLPSTSRRCPTMSLQLASAARTVTEQRRLLRAVIKLALLLLGRHDVEAGEATPRTLVCILRRMGVANEKDRMNRASDGLPVRIEKYVANWTPRSRSF